MPSTPFTLAGVTVALETPRPVAVTESFRPYLGEGGARRVRVRVETAQSLPRLAEPPVYRDISFTVHADGADGFPRRYHDHKEGDRPYAVTRQRLEQDLVEVRYLAGDDLFFSETLNCVSHIALEALLLHCGRLMLHAAYVETEGGALLFSGPSGIGKSTQAALWERYAGARLINGDKTVLSGDGGVWLAHGSPYAGSSRCFVNRSLPVRAIVLLGQSARCAAERLDPAAAFRGLYANTIINSWDADYVARAAALLAQLAAAVPVWRYACTPDRAAVETLAAALRG